MNRIEKMKSSSSPNKFSGIMDCIRDKNISSEEKDLLMKLKNDKSILGGRRISSYAIAALVVLGFEKSTNDEDAIPLIKSFSEQMQTG